MSDGPADYTRRVRERAFSPLLQIPAAAFVRGLARFEAGARALPMDQPFHEPVDVFVFRR